MKYLLTSTDTYRVETVPEVEKLHDELIASHDFTLTAFSYKTKPIKVKGEQVGEYQVVTAKKVFNDEKDPERYLNIIYEEA